MSRRLFCEFSPAAYRISLGAHRAARRLENAFRRDLAHTFSPEALPYRVYASNSLIRRTLGDVDPVLQENKAVNLALAAPRLSGVLIRPGEEFSFWHLVGPCTARRGYKTGLVLHGGRTGQDIGGGMCQMTNLIHWLVLHSPLTVTEHHHHDGYDLFPDYGRTVPFGTGTSILYNYIDYRFRNETADTYQLLVHTDEKYLCGELRASAPLPVRYHIWADDEHFVREADGVYRVSRIMRRETDAATGAALAETCLKTNHAKILYDEAFVRDRIRK